MLFSGTGVSSDVGVFSGVGYVLVPICKVGGVSVMVGVWHAARYSPHVTLKSSRKCDGKYVHAVNLLIISNLSGS